MRRLIHMLEARLPHKKIDIFGKDSLLKSSLPYYMLTIIPAIVLTLDRPNPYVLIAFAYAGLALLDEVFAFDHRNPTNNERIELQKNDHYFRLPLYTAMILSWGIFFKVLNTFSTIELNMENVAFIIGFGFIASNYYTAQFTISHQLMHKPGTYYRIIGTLHLIKFYYMHFTYHHLYRHHVWVGTPKDPSTAKKGQNIYLFIIRSIIYSWKGTYDDEKESGKSFYTNFANISLLGTVIISSGIYQFYGLQALVIHSLMVLGAVAYLEAINYVEHYGLERKLLPNGQYEKTNILHSWNAPHRFTNYFFFKVQRHSDHHENSSKAYQTLTSMDESPFLPHGYILMIVMSFFPKVWFRVMDPLVDAYSKLSPEDKGRIDPEIRDDAIKETRKFLVEVVLVSGVLLFVSLARGC